MNLLLRNFRVIDKGAAFHDQQVSIVVENGLVKAVESPTFDAPEFEVFDGEGAYISRGWHDLRSFCGEPGLEQKETIQSFTESANKGGFTATNILPNTDPVIQSKEMIQYFRNSNSFSSLDIIPMGAVTINADGKVLSEMMDMSVAGTRLFTDGQSTIWHTGILMKTLQYLQKIDAVLVNKSFDKYLTKDGLVHEGIHSTSKGMKGIPALAENVALQRDLEILRYTGGKMHCSLLSTKKSVEMIRQAKEEGLQVTADVAIHQLMFNDEVINKLDSNFKVFPPFRSEKDRQALIEGVAEGIIDGVVSDHCPHEDDCKKLEFDYASFGITGFESFWPLLIKVLGSKMELQVLVELLTDFPRKLQGMDNSSIQIGQEANFTLFDDKTEWEYSRSSSKSQNTPFLGETLKGKVLGIVKNRQFKKFMA